MTKDGSTVRQHAETFARRNPHRAADVLAAVTPQPTPLAAALAVQAFATLSATRSSGFAGPKPLTLADVESYSRMVTPLTPRDVRWVLAMDAAYCEESARNASETVNG